MSLHYQLTMRPTPGAFEHLLASGAEVIDQPERFHVGPNAVGPGLVADVGRIVKDERRVRVYVYRPGNLEDLARIAAALLQLDRMAWKPTREEWKRYLEHGNYRETGLPYVRAHVGRFVEDGDWDAALSALENIPDSASNRRV